MLTEDTQEHREIFGEDGDKVIYFSTPEQLVDQVKKILDNESLRRDIAQRAYLHITSQPHTYKDRLENIINNTL